MHAPPVAPYHQVGHTLEFEIVWDTLAGLNGGAVLKDFCAGNPGVCPENGRAPRSRGATPPSRPLSRRPEAELRQKRRQDLLLGCARRLSRGAAERQAPHQKFKTNKLTGMTYNGEIHMFKVSDVDRSC